ncbi:MAG: hypothetical protein A3G18_07020 [Rhodospirillales bacterium RIFCSPLOWO2_12_FULL_58_28]|nr:MAG: hypothetical protein A3H92_01655 [Rhodospirillales bacterium RIFCSPLOWO2_02_FULL_58_16]OHC78218.1 MAG: hypothetical protein A3G18_07020 [Rhodospirillales bacterium RIFCSPLOWO2_12_FULL_58_28]
MTDRVEWSDDLLTHVDEIDDDHRKLFVLANNVFASVVLEDGAVNQTLGELWTYTKTHFGREEKSMTRTGYSKLAAHKKEHDDLLLELKYLTDRLMESGPGVIGDDVASFLGKWLNDHIMGFDKSYANYLRASGQVNL